ncbi:MAG TPA: YifB family Mg chelatase-like AAA ATPase [Nevskia sp.]|nr:YifB family Mg chelatase-like AAA ATPase [Nevskia sp.]
MVQRVSTVAFEGIETRAVDVQVQVSPGLPAFHVVGLADKAVSEARERVRSALIASGLALPARRITVNLAPADLPKEGGRFDLPIALGVLAASGQIPAASLENLEVLGELSLTGEIRGVRGVLPAALKCSKTGRRLLVPGANMEEALLAGACEIVAANQIGTLCTSLHEGSPASASGAPRATSPAPVPDLAEVRGQHQARRALEIAAAGAHSLLMCGPPGSGKSMLAMRLPGILPPLTQEECIEVAAVASVGAAGFDARDWGRRPYRAPHHTASGVALVGGGSNPRPGEITLAHQGVLFLDELPEFDRHVLEVLREPLESGQITVSRAARQVDFPARFQLVAAMNPCACGYFGDACGKCQCTPDQVARYRSRISGPLLDRIDLQVFVPRLESAALAAGDPPPAEGSAAVRARVVAARARQQARAGKPNAALGPKELERDAPLDAAARGLLAAALERLSLSARAFHRVLKVARTIADLEGVAAVASAHVAEAVRYRQLDRQL